MAKKEESKKTNGAINLDDIAKKTVEAKAEVNQESAEERLLNEMDSLVDNLDTEITLMEKELIDVKKIDAEKAKVIESKIKDLKRLQNQLEAPLTSTKGYLANLWSAIKRLAKGIWTMIKGVFIVAIAVVASTGKAVLDSGKLIANGLSGAKICANAQDPEANMVSGAAWGGDALRASRLLKEVQEERAAEAKAAADKKTKKEKAA